MATVTPKLITAEEFGRMPDPPDGSRQELVRGVIVSMAPPRFRHGKYQFHVAKLLDQFVAPRHLGQVITETGVITERDPDSVRGPDVTYWSAERVPLDRDPEVYPEVAADLCVEIISPHESSRDLREKVGEYFHCGVRMVWLLDIDNRTVMVYRSADRGQILHEGATLSGEDVLPGFSCAVADLFV